MVNGTIFVRWTDETPTSARIYEEDMKMSIYPNVFDLNLNGDTFNALKSDFNMVLRKTLSNMEVKGSEEAELTVKLKIKLKKERDPFAGEGIPREMAVPKFDHKVSSVMQIKDELTGSLGGNYELVWDGERGEYILREIVDGQMNMFDAQYEVVDVQESNADVPRSLPEARVAGFLSAPNSGEGDISKRRETCYSLFPDCRCMTCATFDDYSDISCCTQHDRDCKDTVECFDYVKKVADAYDYSEPEDDGTVTAYNRADGSDEEETDDE